MTMKVTLVTLVLALYAQTVYGWGADGHMAVGYVAMQFLSPKALSFVKTNLGTTYNQSLGPASTWADSIKRTRGYTWSAKLHYLDAQDNPPSFCNVTEARDCADGQCILSAIANYTQRVVDTSLSAKQRQEALKFLTHFVGDIGQPLHNEAIALGGNEINVQCDGKSINLHALWDTGIIKKLLSTSHSDSLDDWVKSLLTRIKSGDFKSQVAAWITCSSTSALVQRIDIAEDIAGLLRSSSTPLACPHVWSTDANAYDCTTIFNYNDGDDLCVTNYYDSAVPVIESQIAKQGYRLAAWLNVLFDGSSMLPGKGG